MTPSPLSPLQLLVLGVGLLLALALPARAAVFPDVPTDHWAYEAVTYLQDKGLVEGYPDGTFKGNRTLTRYEFAIVVARLYDKLVEMVTDGGAVEADVDAIYARLEEEFGADIDELREMVENQDERLIELEAAFGTLTTRTDKNESDIKDLLGRVGRVKLTGDMRTRFELIEFDEDKDPNKRARIRLRLKGEAAVNEDMKAVFRLATGDSNAVTSTNESLEDDFGMDNFQLDQAYLEWKPKDSEALGGWSLTAGKFAPTWKTSLMLWDSDTNVEGLGWRFFMDDPHWRVNLAQLVPETAGFMLVNQVGYEDLAWDGLDVYAGWTFLDDKAFSLVREEAGKTGTPFPNKMTFSDIAVDSEFSQWDVLAMLDTAAAGWTEYPLVLTGHYTESTYDVAPGGHDHLTKAAFANLTGGTLKEPGDWKWFLEWGRFQPNAVVSFWTDADRGAGNTEFWAAGGSYQWMSNIELALTVYDAETFFPSNSGKGFFKVQLDAVAKF